MLGANDRKILLGLLPQMGTIMNAVPGEAFSCKDVETLTIMQRRLGESDLKNELCMYNEIFAKQASTQLTDIANSLIAYIRIKVLLESDTDTFDDKVNRELFKAYKEQITRTGNVMRITKATSVTVDEFQKKQIELTIQKNETFVNYLEQEINSIEEKLENETNNEEDNNKNEAKSYESDKAAIKIKTKRSSIFGKKKTTRKDKKSIGEHLRNEEQKHAKSFCEEIQYYDKKLSFTASIVCKDIPEYSLIIKNKRIFFGISENISKGSYDNADETLLELTKASDEFVQFMSVDLLSGEYNLKAFSEKERSAMQMYFDFITSCFEKYIGVTLTVQEYLGFKKYYNRLVVKMFELEQSQKEEHYRALILADRYLCYMQCYCLQYVGTVEDVISNIIGNCCTSYIDDINLILNNHIVDEGAKEDLEALKNELEHFHKESKCVADVYEEQQDVVIPIVMENENQTSMKIVIQILNEKHEVVDEALYAGNNLGQALCDFDRKEGYIKRLGFRNNGVDEFYKEEVSE